MTLPTLSAQAEASIRLLNQTLALHKSTAATLVAQQQPNRLAAPPFDALQVQRQATLLRLVSIAESFSFRLLTDTTEERFISTGDSDVMARLWEQAAIDAGKTWESQVNSYKEWLAITVNRDGTHGLIEARNAVAHGLGALTRQQLKTADKTLGRLKTAKITVSNDRIVLNDSDLQTACDVLKAFVERLDHAVATSQ